MYYNVITWLKANELTLSWNPWWLPPCWGGKYGTLIVLPPCWSIVPTSIQRQCGGMSFFCHFSIVISCHRTVSKSRYLSLKLVCYLLFALIMSCGCFFIQFPSLSSVIRRHWWPKLNIILMVWKIPEMYKKYRKLVTGRQWALGASWFIKSVHAIVCKSLNPDRYTHVCNFSVNLLLAHSDFLSKMLENLNVGCYWAYFSKLVLALICILLYCMLKYFKWCSSHCLKSVYMNNP